MRYSSIDDSPVDWITISVRVSSRSGKVVGRRVETSVVPFPYNNDSCLWARLLYVALFVCLLNVFIFRLQYSMVLALRDSITKYDDLLRKTAVSALPKIEALLHHVLDMRYNLLALLPWFHPLWSKRGWELSKVFVATCYNSYFFRSVTIATSNIRIALTCDARSFSDACRRRMGDVYPYKHGGTALQDSHILRKQSMIDAT